MKMYINIIILFLFHFFPLTKTSESESEYDINYEFSYYANGSNSSSIFIPKSFFYLKIDNGASYKLNYTNSTYYFKYIANNTSENERLKFIILKEGETNETILSCSAKLPLHYNKKLLVNCSDNKRSNLSITFTLNENNKNSISIVNDTYHIELNVTSRKHFVILNALYNDSQIYGNIIILLGMFIILYGVYYSKFTVIIYSICLVFIVIKEVQEILTPSLDFDTVYFPFIVISALIIGGFLGDLFAYHLPHHPFMGFLFGMVLYHLISVYCVSLILSKHTSGIDWYNIFINDAMSFIISLFFGFLWNRLSKTKIGSILIILSTSFVGSYIIIYGVSLFLGGYFLEKPFYILFNNINENIVKKYWTSSMLFYLGLFFGLFILSFLFQFHTLVTFNLSDKKEKKINELSKEKEKEEEKEIYCNEKSYEKSKEDLYKSKNENSQALRFSRVSDGSYGRVSLNNMSNRSGNITFENSGIRMNQEGGE